jgi:hypothetical protein
VVRVEKEVQGVLMVRKAKDTRFRSCDSDRLPPP